MTSPLRVLAACVLMVAASGAPGRGQAEQPSSPRVDVSKLGPQVGQPVPDFTLLDQTGAARTLRSIMGRRGAVIVFIRSADW